MKKHMIWASKIDIEDFEEFFEEEEEELGEAIGEDERYRRVYEMNSAYLDDARANLDIEVDGRILVIGSMGLWSGRRSGYKIVESSNIKDVLQGEYDDMEFYCDAYNLRATGWHHDGTNYMEYRLVPPGMNIDRLLEALYNNKEVSRLMIRRYTRSLRPYIAEVYGW